ncbi:hypothetical protein C8A05DRAFT_34004 [Staphylotrichum tortipilum]|uniref:Uncharacterized protein n=1 Tax=Staphylotrichum tortipilum TaxID=2831512 RepID=A0AAN6MKL0_9PEZI|nr:hypothetical protein C8A05DRAFT_34004 [Staphylotrichum longicolle]
MAILKVTNATGLTSSASSSTTTTSSTTTATAPEPPRLIMGNAAALVGRIRLLVRTPYICKYSNGKLQARVFRRPYDKVIQKEALIYAL